MTLGLGVLLSLFLLAPGLAFHAGLFSAPGLRGLRFAAPAPNSVLTLSLIGFSALMAHAAWAAISTANDLLAGAGLRLVELSFQPNIYATMLRMEHGAPPSSTDITVALLSMIVLSALAWLVARRLRNVPPIRSMRYGWLEDFIDLAAPPGRYSTAFVLSAIEIDDALIGYEGLIENLALNSDKEVTAITLTDVTRFLVRISDGELERSDVHRDPIPRLYIDKANFRNVALTVFEDEEKAAETPDGPSDGPGSPTA